MRKPIFQSILILLTLSTGPAAVVTAGNGVTLPQPAPELVTVMIHPYSLPDQDALQAHEAQARLAAEAHPAVQALRAGSFFLWTEYEYAPGMSYLHYRTWHQQRVLEKQDEILVLLEAGYHTRVGVDPTTGEVAEVLVAPRTPQAVAVPLSPEQAEAIRIARSDKAVQEVLHGWDVYPRLVLWTPEFAGPSDLSCIRGGCAEVYLQGINDNRQLRVTVDLLKDAAVALELIDWGRPILSPPLISLTSSSIPALGQSQEMPAGSFSDHGWAVNYDVTVDDAVEVSNVRKEPSGATGELVAASGNIPFIEVWYDQCGSSAESSCHSIELCTTTLCSRCLGVNGCLGHGVEVHWFSDRFWVHAEYYAGCPPELWSETAYGCYKFEQRYTFWDGTAFHPWILISGPGQHNRIGYGGGHYYVPIYLDLDIDDAAGDTSARYGSTGWFTTTAEHNHLYATPVDAQGYEWNVSDDGVKFVRIKQAELEDNAYWFVLRYEPLWEPEVFPSQYDNDQATTAQDLMFYYTLRRHDGCMPTDRCLAGPVLRTNW